jgi:hypothetical protein
MCSVFGGAMQKRFGMVVAVLLVACGGDDKGARGDDFARLVEASCKKAVSCPIGKAEFGTYDLCRSFYDLLLCGQPTPEVHGLDACLKQIDSAQCDELYGEDGLAACKGLDILTVPGRKTVAVGERCDEDKNRCASDAICDADFDACGKCVAAPGVGESCVQFQCGDDAFCKDDTSCVAKQKSGTACTASDQCSGLCVAGTCTSPKDLIGKSCSDNAECGGLRCLNGKCAARALPGESCRMSTGAAATFDCVIGADCEQGKCALIPACGESKEHEPCNRTANCADPLVCSITDSTCEQPSATCNTMNGTSNIQGECKRGDYCAPTGDASGAGTCKPLQADGAACESASECTSDLCAGGLCGKSACDVPSGQASHAVRAQSLKSVVLPLPLSRALRF